MAFLCRSVYLITVLVLLLDKTGSSHPPTCCLIATLGWHNIESAICITGNKGQGSQYPVVIVLVDAFTDERDGSSYVSPNFSRTLMYTMDSRAVRKLIIICNYESDEVPNGELGQIILHHKEAKRFHDLYTYLPTLS